MYAVESGNFEFVLYCLNEQMNPFLKDALDRDALEYAQSSQYTNNYANMINLVRGAK